MTSTSSNNPANGEKLDARSLKDELQDALPTGFHCKTRYLHSPPKPCDSLFSSLPGQNPEKTRLASHFLTVSADASALPQSGTGDVINFAIEVLVYTTRKLTTIFVSKVDSTAYVPRIRPSPVKTAVTTFLKWLAEKERRKRPNRKIVVSLFARAQSQYLFPGSSDDKGKHVLDDRQLIRWWARVLDPIIPIAKTDDANAEELPRYQGYLTVPGYAKTELKSFMPPSAAASKPRWLPGHPLIELGRTRGVPEHAPPRCLLPRFPDDPKARFISDLDDEIGVAQDSQLTASPSKVKSARWKSVMSLDQFWEQMEFRQECSSGRVVGFLWLVISPNKDEDDVFGSDNIAVMNADSQDSTVSVEAAPTSQPKNAAATSGSPKKRKRKPLTGVIVPRLPKIKSTQSNLLDMQAQLDAESGHGILVNADGYDKAMSTMLHLDFSTLEAAIWSTTKWTAEVQSIAGLNGDFAVDVVGTAQVEIAASATAANGAGVNDMSGMIRKKRKAEPASESQQPAVNVLGAGMVRKKPKPAS
ncbi:Histone acetyltransferase [Cercospora beticola]|uniref:histone acetyltransferase n=1 Tax=Cercospora beticola TaxID=122368 RepID=A0A2G5HIP3_CERBT|nr:Histone acetyltransferase [Cercospora beticola]PIA92410.1 Histone acetyltransferase [Cercospora beticola]WPB05741.1 hypothetical protein RHO25_010395 [Cercospora beticola]